MVCTQTCNDCACTADTCDAPAGEKRLDRHVAFLVENLEYEYEEGRKAVLELIDK